MPSFEVTEEPARELDAARIQREVRSFNASVVDEADFRPLLVLARDDSGSLIGGLVGETYWDWLYVDSLWVAAEHRHQGCGTRILEFAESEAVKRGCHSAFLETFSFQGRPLYERLGYRIVGTIRDFPMGHERYSMVKSLRSTGAA
jgi:GNAT superfamily N-acetyltransferase